MLKRTPKQMPRSHVVIIDGTQSRLQDGEETNAGLLYKLLEEARDEETTTLWYNPGIQGHGFWNWVTIASGWGINQTIREAYARLSSVYRPGDRIYLFGYSRGAYAVRSLAGMINRVGLLRQDKTIERRVSRAFNLYETNIPTQEAKEFCGENCHMAVNIEMIGIWDTVKALGLPYPLLTRLAPMATEFHNHSIGGDVRHGFHALAYDETRTAYSPTLWAAEPDWHGLLEQVWFRGAHSDIGGHVWRFPAARPLANIPLVWMLERVEDCGLKLPNKWRTRFPCDVNAPKNGDRRGIAKFFFLRKKRTPKPSHAQYIHHTLANYLPTEKFGLPVQEPRVEQNTQSN